MTLPSWYRRLCLKLLFSEDKMPSIITRGAFSAKSFGFGAKVSTGFGIFNLGVNSSCYGIKTRDKYAYSTDAVTAGANASINNASGTAAGNSTVGIFQLGITYPNCAASPYTISTTRNKYTYATDSNASAAAASAGNYGGAAAGNATRGIFALGGKTDGSYSTTRNKFTYACCTSGAAAASSNNSGEGAASGNTTRGIFALGYGSYPASGTTTRNKFTYACCSNASATASSCNSWGGAATGTCAIGIFAIGSNGQNNTGSGVTTTRNKYTYATDTNASATAASAKTLRGSAAGNLTRGIFSRGETCTFAVTTTRDKYTYATDANTSATAASVATGAGSATTTAAGINF